MSVGPADAQTTPSAMSCRFLVGRIRAVAFAVFFLLAGLSGPASAAERELRAAVFVSARVVHVRDVIAPWIAALNEALDGTAHVTLYGGGALGRDGKLQWRLLRSGVSDITWLPVGYEAGRFPATEIFELPLLSDDPLRLTRAAWRLYERGELPGFEEVKVLALSVSPAYGVHLAFPLDSMADLAGARIRVVNHAQAGLVRALGAVPVAGIGANALAESLSRHLVDGALFGWHAIRPVGIERVSETHIIEPIGFALSAIVMNRDSFAALPSHARAAIEGLSGEPLSVAFTARLVAEAEAARARVAAAGHRLYRPGPQEAARVRAYFAAYGRAWRARDPERRRIHDALARMLRSLQEERAGDG